MYLIGDEALKLRIETGSDYRLTINDHVLGWSATTKVLKESYSTVTRITRNNGQNDIDILFRHMTTDATGMPSCPGPTHSSGVMVQVGRVGRPAIRWGCRGTRWVSSTDRMLTSTAVPILMYSLIQVGWRVAL